MVLKLSGTKAPLAALFCGMFAIVQPAWADIKDGVDAWSRGDYDAAVREWRGPAAQGNPDAQFNLAQAYKLGRGVKRDLVRAEQLFADAAAKGHLQAADNYGLLLFQRGERAKAMPFIHAASDRGDPRAQYVLGLAYFNGENVPKDWVRAYALASLAQQAGLPQAASALKQMDQYVSLEDRQRSVPLAAELAAKAEATRQSQVAAADLGVTGSGSAQSSPSASLKPFKPKAPVTTASGSPATAGADYARPIPTVASILNEKPATAAPRPAPGPVPATVARPSYPAIARPAAGGNWRVQLGAFGVASNADKLWNRVRGRPELSGHPKLEIPAGRVTKLQAGGFSSRGDAQAACDRLKAGGYDCIVVES